MKKNNIQGPSHAIVRTAEPVWLHESRGTKMETRSQSLNDVKIIKKQFCFRCWIYFLLCCWALLEPSVWSNPRTMRGRTSCRRPSTESTGSLFTSNLICATASRPGFVERCCSQSNATKINRRMLLVGWRDRSNWLSLSRRLSIPILPDQCRSWWKWRSTVSHAVEHSCCSFYLFIFCQLNCSLAHVLANLFTCSRTEPT